MEQMPRVSIRLRLEESRLDVEALADAATGAALDERLLPDSRLGAAAD